MNNQARFDEATGFVSLQLRQPLQALPEHWKRQIHEIRLRSDQPVVLITAEHSLFLDQQGNVLEKKNKQELICSHECLEQTFRAVCGYSVHTHQREMIHGYIPLRGGHRAGLGATAVEREGTVTSVKEISSLNIRIARQVFGAADPLVPTAQQGGLLLAGGPGSGKTTLLRDLARQLAGGEDRPGKKVVLLDERGELAAMWDGIPQNDVGINTDVLNGFPKAIGMEMAVRSLSPDIILCDEIGSRREAEGIVGCMNAGVQMIASVHAGSMNELARKPWVMELLKLGAFPTVVLLNNRKGVGQIETIYRTDEWLHEMDGNSFNGGGPLCNGYANGGLL